MSYHIAPGQANIATYRRYIYAEKTGIYRKVYRDMYAEGKEGVGIKDTFPSGVHVVRAHVRL